MKKILLMTLPLLMLSCGHQDPSPTPAVKTTTTARPVKRAVALNPAAENALAARQNEGPKRLVMWNGNNYAVTMVKHRRPSNPALPGYVLSFSGMNMLDGTRTTLMMQVPDQLKEGRYTVKFDPDLGQKLGNRPKDEMSLIGQVVHTDTRGQVVAPQMQSGNVMNEGELTVEAINNETFVVKATLRTLDKNEYKIDYSGPCNME